MLRKLRLRQKKWFSYKKTCILPAASKASTILNHNRSSKLKYSQKVEVSQKHMYHAILLLKLPQDKCWFQQQLLSGIDVIACFRWLVISTGTLQHYRYTWWLNKLISWSFDEFNFLNWSVVFLDCLHNVSTVTIMIEGDSKYQF